MAIINILLVGYGWYVDLSDRTVLPFFGAWMTIGTAHLRQLARHLTRLFRSSPIRLCTILQ